MVECSRKSDEIRSFRDVFSQKTVRKSSQRGGSRRGGRTNRLIVAPCRPEYSRNSHDFGSFCNVFFTGIARE